MSKKNVTKKEFRTFTDLTTLELYEILKLRINVFVVEQDCPYSDLDDKDQSAIHYSYTLENDKVVGYLRILSKGVSYEEVSIGRVIIDPEFRSEGWGHELMNEALSYIETEIGETAVKISAQKHLEKFYEKHGFKSTGKEYLEDGIPHVQMLRL